MELARRELGEDALLINARPAARETRRLGAFEVVFGIPPAAEVPPAELAPTSANRLAPFLALSATAGPAGPLAPDSGWQDVKAELSALHREVAKLASGLKAATALPAALLASGIPADMARQVADGASLDDFFEVDATLGRPGAPRAIAALVGPPGAGKTTALMKLAATHGLAAGRPVRVVSIDVRRIAAADQIQALAAILGIRCVIAPDPPALMRALQTQNSEELLLIDTPGFGPKDIDACAGWTRILSSHAEVDVHLVLPCTLSERALRDAGERFAPFRPDKLLFTHLDEARWLGAAVGEAARCQLPISFLSGGQEIPADIERATKERMRAGVRGLGDGVGGAAAALLATGAAA